MIVFSNTNIGLVRSSNQDTYKSGVLDDNCLWSLVCDGMGGASGGGIASAIASEVISQVISDGLTRNMNDEELMNLSFKAINQANSAVFSRSVDEPELKGMGTTAVLAIVENKKLYLSHIGDSRAYLVRAGVTTQLTTDHSYVQGLVEKGEISKEEARVHPHRNIITRVVGVHSMVENDYQIIELEEGDVFMSCSDGLSNYLTDNVLAELISKTNKEEITETLIQYALANGGSDNITVSLIYV